MIKDLLTAALQYREMGQPCIAVRATKKPYRSGWNRLFNEAQTENEVRLEFSNGTYGLAAVLYPASNYIHLDFDGPCSGAAFESTGIDLPETAQISTPSGGSHLIFTASPLLREFKISRKVRLVKAGCSCKKNGKPHRCGVDLLLNGYSVVPPTKGYGEDPEHPLEDAVEIPDALIELALRKHKTKSQNTLTNGARIVDGERNSKLASLAGTMRRRDLSYEAILAALKVENQTKCDPPLDENDVESIAKSISRYEPHVEPEHFTDLGNARRLATHHKNDLRYCYGVGSWFMWDGRRWEKDNRGGIDRLAKETVKKIYTEAAASNDGEIRKAIASHAKRSESDARIAGMKNLARSEMEMAIVAKDLDTDPWVLNVRNGTIDLKTGKLRPHNRNDLITKLAGAAYYPDATCPLWEATLNHIMGGNVDDVQFLQRVFGYALTGDVREQCFFIFHGTGANGKTTIIKTLISVLEDYALQSPVETFYIKKGDHIPNDVARLRGARFVAAIEGEADKPLAESLVKQLTGGDRVAARFLNHEWFEFDPYFKLFLGTNHRPRIRGTDNAIWRRIRLVPFTVAIPEHEQDKDLADKLLQERDGILRWAVEGCLAWQAEGLGISEAVRAATDTYRDESDIIGGFLTDCCDIAPTMQITSKELYTAYIGWCEENHENRPLGNKSFGATLTERGFEKGRTNKERLWYGLQLTKSSFE